MPPALLSPPKISLGVTEACPLRCRHCYADCDAAPKPAELGIDAWMALADRLIADGVIQFYFEGGEPLLKPGFPALLARCARDAMTLLRTHGTLIDDAMADALRAAGVGRVLVDLMGACAGTHDAATGVPGSFAASCAGLRRCAERGIATDALVILTRQTAPELNDLLRLAAGLGAERVGVLRLYPLGRAKRRWDELALSLEEQMAAIRGLDPPPGLSVMQSWHPYDRNCCWQAAAIDATGRAIGCMYLREYADFGRVAGEGAVPFLDIWRHQPAYRRLRAGTGIERACGDCAGNDGSRGGCRASAYAFHGRWTAPDPFDEALNDGIDLRVLPGHARG
ncbi:radical SAM protein [Roseomonas sp. NAR14]|uniref:Radical SAM protein n=1 Tax=Roseomonas acroporae TaxID=2937791 RepID=A0A9X2BWN3_9PROT|nr:radical SAM protein [Roseomonas acroporae]MCK8784065.1 radical SAM protein [Roseomonas acroporae]